MASLSRHQISLTFKRDRTNVFFLGRFARQVPLRFRKRYNRPPYAETGGETAKIKGYNTRNIILIERRFRITPNGPSRRKHFDNHIQFALCENNFKLPIDGNKVACNDLRHNETPKRTTLLPGRVRDRAKILLIKTYPPSSFKQIFGIYRYLFPNQTYKQTQALVTVVYALCLSVDNYFFIPANICSCRENFALRSRSILLRSAETGGT